MTHEPIAYGTLSDEFLARQRLLVIAPHADDECFGCAGTMARVKALGGEVFVVVVSVGDLQHYTAGGFVKGETRASEFERVMTFLEVDDWDILFRDAQTHQRLDAVPRRALIELLERDGKMAFDRIKPTIVALPAISYNQDHEAVFRAGLTACRPGLPDIKQFQPIVLTYDNTALFWSLEREKFHPNLYVDISAFLPKKLEALAMHRSQMRATIHHSSVENVEYMAKVRGREISIDAAEGYMVLRFVL